ncbi:hypothetical protein EPUS_00943 [Endocarpon pusillum Z07020]|uniref:Xylanolytic transcriptional activator regulatory domain-containing protein n=1 Tax=Endocarpon pusillum (strain Z07020 / HMAS-L-300199) TaxID=1263415 RepID=U1HWD3_ENDPU|nr:uncharacterized protein EPUS_00943 [Endocarpon pusillum Z07020]ERF73689.1 hypothetical protein EPUS_00943 [Endocarpon pusillum Z07020]
MSQTQDSLRPGYYQSSMLKMLGTRRDLRSSHQKSLQVNPSPSLLASLTPRAVPEEEESSVPHIEQAQIVAASITQPGPQAVPLFVGEGGYGDILAATGNVDHRHFIVPGEAEKPLAPEDLAFLKVKGCFSLPAESGELIKAYFQYFHPSFPVLDGPSFLQEYASSGLNKINLLLIWSIFSISASYLPIQSRRATKEVCVQRAKLLFDLTHESDKIVLIQSALLLSFWFVDAEDIKQSWYWSGIAFGIAQTLGLHRALDVGLPQSSMREQILWRNIWRCCMFRDVWLSYGMGRPLRINATNCKRSELPFSENHVQGIAFDGVDLYTPAEAAGFMKMWQVLVGVGTTLRAIMSIGQDLSPAQTKSFGIQICPQSDWEQTLLLTVVSRQLRLHQNAALSALYRSSDDREKLGAVAADTTSVIHACLDDGTTDYVAPTTIPLVVPAMLVQLKMLKSTELKSRKQGESTLELYFRFLTAIEDNYPAASIVKRLFAAAQNFIFRSDSGTIHKDQLTSIPSPLVSFPSSQQLEYDHFQGFDY